jgi:hypothetical protein
MATYQITSLAFDFDDDNSPEPDLAESVTGTIWEADDPDDLVEEITAAYGWCIRSLDWRIVLS